MCGLVPSSVAEQLGAHTEVVTATMQQCMPRLLLNIQVA